MLFCFYREKQVCKNMDNIKELSTVISKLKNDKEISAFLHELLTKSELDVLSKRWCILKMLEDGLTKRDIAKQLKVSLCKVTRGSRILKNKNSLTKKYLKKG